MYNRIFVANLRRAMAEKKVSRKELSERSGVSPSFLFETLHGRTNPSLKTMEAIAGVLGVPLELLLSKASLDPEALDGMETSSAHANPIGYESVFAILPEYQAFIVRKWARRSAQKLMGTETPRQGR